MFVRLYLPMFSVLLQSMQPSESAPLIAGSTTTVSGKEVLRRSASDEDRFSPHFKTAGPASGRTYLLFVC